VYVATVENVVRWSFVWTWPVVSDERARRIMQGARARLEAAVK
jgi:hypothetical protein